MKIRLRLDRLKPWQLDVSASGLILVAALAVYGLVMVPSLARHDAAVALQNELQIARDRDRDLTEALQRMQQRKAGFEAFVSASGLALESESHTNDRIALLQKIAASAGLQVEGFEPSKPEPSGRLIATEFRLSAKAVYPDIVRFIAAVHKEHPDCIVDSFELRTAPAAKEPEVAVSLHLVWYATPEKPLASK